MGSIADNKPTLSKQPHSPPIVQDSDAETQSPSSSSSSGEEEEANGDECDWFRETIPVDYVDDETVALDETQLLNLYGETQVLEYSDFDEDEVANVNVNGETQLSSDGDGGESNRTEVLSDCDDEGGRVGGDVGCSPCEQGGKDFFANSDASAERQSTPGSAQRSIMSIRTASLRANGRAASRSMTPDQTGNGATSVKKDIEKDDGMVCMGDPTAGSTDIRKFVLDPKTQNSNGDTMRDNNNERESRVASTTVRRLFNDDENNLSENDNDCSNGAEEVQELPNCCQDFAGLSYVGSEEPGELTQTNALHTVDKFLSANHVELSQEVPRVKVVKEVSALVTSAKGIQRLAKRVSTRSPGREAEIYDWVDSHEDDGGGAFFSKNKGASFGGRGCEQRFLPPPQKLSHPNSSKARCLVDKPREKVESVQLHQKITSSSTSRLTPQNLKDGDKIVQNLNSKKNVTNDLDERLNAECPEQSLEKTGMEFPEMYDIGPDTQMAAEAIEALCYAPPATYNTDDLYPNNKNVSSDVSKNTSLHKKPQSKLGGTLKQTKRTVNLDKKINNGKEEPKVEGKAKKRKADAQEHLPNQSNGSGKQRIGRKSSEHIPQRKTLAAKEEPKVENRAKKRKVDPQQHLSNQSNDNGKPKLGRKSSGHIPQRKTLATKVRPNEKGFERCDSPAISKNQLNLQVDIRTFTPVACRTRRRVGAKDQQEAGTCGGKGGTSGAYAPKTLTAERKTVKLGSGQFRKVRKDHPTQKEPPGFIVAREDIATVGNQKAEALNCPKSKRTSEKISVYPRKDSNMNELSTLGGKFEAIEPFIPRRKRSKVGVKGLVIDKSSTYSCRKGGADTLSSTEGVQINITVNVVSPEKVKPSDTVHVTPTKRGPTCISDDCQKRSCKKNQSRLSLKAEVNELDTTEVTKDYLRRRRDMTDVRVLLSNHLDEDIIKQQKKISAKLGVSVVSSSSEATHFVTDKFARTKNMLEAIALGKPVVTHLWLESCGLANFFVDEKSYILRDFKKEKEIGFSMPVSLARACQYPLLQGKRVFATQNVKPSMELIASLVRAVHGQGKEFSTLCQQFRFQPLHASTIMLCMEATAESWDKFMFSAHFKVAKNSLQNEVVENIGQIMSKDSNFPDDLLVLSCEEDYETDVPLLEKGAAVYSSELLLNGIVIQKLQYKRHRLFADHVNKRKRISSATMARRDGIQFHPVSKCK